MPTYFLKFDNEQQAKDAFIAAGVELTEDGKFPPSATVDGKNMSIDVLYGTGILLAPTDETIVVDGIESKKMVAVDGYHVNVTYVPDSLIPYQLPEPEFPKCIFA